MSKYIYVSGVGGVAMGPLARIARDLGYDVIGTDAAESRYTKDVAAEDGIDVHIGQTREFIAEIHEQQPIDWFVYTAGLPDDHPELAFAREAGIRVSKRDEFINELIEEKNLKLLAVSGTHGKTTTTGMIIWLFKQLGIPLSYSIGTRINFGPNGQYADGSEYFAYEADEYDRNMLQFHPYAAIITSIDYDHPDTYPTREDYDEAFQQFVQQTHCVYAWTEDCETIGVDDVANKCVHAPRESRDQALKLTGEHNRDNAQLVLNLARDLFPDRDQAELARILNDFPGTERRFEKLADNIYTDYAHHPAEIEATLALAREVNKHAIAVYQPHQNVRQHGFKDEYRNSFASAEKVYWLPTYLTREDENLEVLQPDDLIKLLDSATQERTEVADLDNTLAQRLKDHAAQGRLVLIMGAGDIDDWAREHLV